MDTGEGNIIGPDGVRSPDASGVVDLQLNAVASAPAAEGASPIAPPPPWEDNPYRRRGAGWEATFADTGLGPIITLACLAGPAALAMGLVGLLRLRGQRARRKAWIMVAVAVPMTAAYVLLVVFGKKA